MVVNLIFKKGNLLGQDMDYRQMQYQTIIKSVKKLNSLLICLYEIFFHLDLAGKNYTQIVPVIFFMTVSWLSKFLMACFLATTLPESI